MNPSNADISFPARPVELKVRRTRPPMSPDPAARHEVPVHAVAPGGDIRGDLEALRVCEENLRAYEQRLREWQDELEQAQARTVVRRSAHPWTPADVPAHPDSWEKLVRARELLEVEQKHLRDDRITLQGFEQQLKEREAGLRTREAHLVAREQQLAELETVRAVRPNPPGTFGSLTRGPFALAKSVFGAKA